MPRVMNEQPQVSSAPADSEEGDDFRLRADGLRGMMRSSGETEFIEPDDLRQDDMADFHDERNLAAPPARAGYTQRWIRVQDKAGLPDTKRWFEALQQGYRPRDPDTIKLGHNFWPKRQFEGTSVFQVGNCVLCEIPEARRQRLLAKTEANNKRLQIMTTQDLEAANAEGMRLGVKPIHRDHDVQVTRRPPTMAN